MIYKVKAKVIDETIGEFYSKLVDGTVAEQRPDGEEIAAAMKRAVLTGPGVAEWYEMCFCEGCKAFRRSGSRQHSDAQIERRPPPSLRASCFIMASGDRRWLQSHSPGLAQESQQKLGAKLRLICEMQLCGLIRLTMSSPSFHQRLRSSKKYLAGTRRLGAARRQPETKGWRRRSPPFYTKFPARMLASCRNCVSY